MSKQRLATLRTAFAETMSDPAFRAEAERQGLSVEPIGGEELASLIDNAYRTPAEVVQATIKALGRAP